MHSVPDNKAKLDAQTTEASKEGQDDNDQDEEGDENDGGEEIGQDYHMSGGTETQRNAPSSTGPKYTVISVTKVPHTFGSDEFVFKDSKGRSRSTKREDWKRVIYNGALAWKYSHYICLENHFK
jgi:hypothetical protein